MLVAVPVVGCFDNAPCLLVSAHCTVLPVQWPHMYSHHVNTCDMAAPGCWCVHTQEMCLVSTTRETSDVNVQLSSVDDGVCMSALASAYWPRQCAASGSLDMCGCIHGLR